MDGGADPEQQGDHGQDMDGRHEQNRAQALALRDLGLGFAAAGPVRRLT
jgi:hypothetical protein